MKIEKGLLLTGAEPVKHGVHEVWHATVKVSRNKSVRAFVKRCPPRELVIEVIASLIGRSLGLPLPIPILVLVHPGRIAQLDLDGPELFFGSQSQNEPDLSQILQDNGDERSLMQRLKSWPHAVFGGCFDEWIANEDRNLQNMLYDGGKNFVLIDHGKAIPEGLEPVKPTSKNLLLQLSNSRSLSGVRHKVNEKGAQFIKECNDLSLEDVLQSVANSIGWAEAYTSEVGDFLQRRLPELGEIIAGKLGDRGNGSLFKS